MSSDKRVVFLSGKITNLRPLHKNDIPDLTRWINDPRVREFLATTTPYTEKMEEDWFNKIGTKDDKVTLGIETKDGQLIGIMDLHQIDWKNGIATTGAFIGEVEYWGNGYGTDAKMALLDYAFNTLGLRKICSAVFSFNKRSLQYSLHCGYRIEGRFRKEEFRRGKFWDKIVLGLFRDEWLPIWKKYQRTGKVR